MTDGNILLNKMKRAELEERLTTLTGMDIIMLQNLVEERMKKSNSIVTKCRWNEILYKLGCE